MLLKWSWKKNIDICNLVQKSDYNAKITDIESQYITTPNYNKFTKHIVTNKI